MNVIFGNYMNINLGNQGIPQGFTPMLIGQASPYLSPLYGSLSILDKNSHDDLLDFQLQEPVFQTIVKEPQIQQEQFNPQLILELREGDSEAKIQTQQYRLQNQEIKTPSSIIKNNQTKVYSIIQFLVLNDRQGENQLLQFGKPLYENQNKLQYVFKTLLTKFKKLRKTKQEMVKYCMRKAFKFTSQISKSPKSRNRKQKGDKNIEKDLSIEMPFRKNSSQKTMNSHFLKQVFSNKQFLLGYSQFLHSISQIIEQDNNSKISYLADTIQKILITNQIKQIQNIKRLPWTKSILTRTQELAKNLMEFANVQSNFVSQFENNHQH